MVTTAGLATCVIVDDHEAVRTGTRARLETIEWLSVIGEATCGVDAIELIRSHRPTLALVDFRLPDGDGLCVARTIATEGIDTRIVIYSGHATTTLAEQALELGVSGFVLKDSPLSTIIDALRLAREGGRYLDPTIAAELICPSGARCLSPRERQILALVADGGQNASIAHQLSISAETVKAHVSNILLKLGAGSRTEAVAKALREGVIT